MPDYRLGELARISGVSARNIRAYRERGLLDAPRRDGRAALYDDHHLAQLQTISRLLRRGYTSAHIVEFFEAVRAGGDLAEFLGLEYRAVIGDLPADDAAALLRAGLLRRSAGDLEWVNPAIAAAVGRAEDGRGRVRFMMQLIEAVDEDLRRAVGEAATLVDEEEAGGRDEDRRQLCRLVITGRLDAIVGERIGP
ncbi:MerR family transcriptional regulator [Mycolicibacterium sp. 120266]|uniref:MerR family transcriptional regulator n=1 Tax=Mycolicibacterium sp. 120266 TaxID=3090601 RepID=UPI00299E9F6F|nr:MerR family transcriptional regulator [Mycolicibacterium sp. 120266]MDX1874113.1 MerR family transcriptional regulator [Mycolicibacterium sp. 120266]